jgi:hypothetical protein
LTLEITCVRFIYGGLMTLYKMVHILKVNGYSYVTFFPGHEVWEKGDKQITIPSNKDTIHKQIARDILYKIYE